jgi:anaerobic magnesium-protoporphyrin IX monomethyl ester cyclase
MKILLVCKSKVMENLGLMYISAVVKKSGHESKITDINDAFIMAKVWKPDIIGYSVMTGDQEKFKTLTHRIKEHLPHVQIIIGGPHPTFFPDDLKDCGTIFPGEAENEISELLGSTERYHDLDSIPWPDRKDFPNMKIRDFISSRGCPFDCHYCYNDRWAKMFPDLPQVRTRSVKDVIKEIKSVSPEFVYFQDSCFGVSKKWMHEFSALYRHEVGTPYHCHLRPSQVDEERVLMLRESHCISVRIALETSSQRLRTLIGRSRTTNEETFNASRILRKHGINLMVQNMLGLPTSTIEEDLETLETNIIAQPSYGWCSIFAPYPGTELGDYCLKEGIYTGDYSELSDSFFEKSVLNFTEEHKEQLVCLQRSFALCVEAQYLPAVNELTYENFPKLVHKIMRRIGDNRLYGGII